MDNLRKRTLSGLGWSGAAQVLGRGVQFVVTVVLARLLSPIEFGLMGMIFVFTEFAASFSDMGLGASVIQKKAIDDRHLNSVFWLNVAMGSVLTLLFALASPLVAGFYGEPQLRLLTAAVAVNFVLNSLNVVQFALLEKSLNFRTKFWIELVSIFISGIVALALAFNGAGVWSLVWQSISMTAVRTAVMWRLSNWRPGMTFDFSAIRELMRFGGHLVGFGLVNYWGRNFDKMVIGRLLGSAALGIYGLADRLMHLPLTNITSITSTVMFPALSTIQDDVESVKRVYLRANRMIALLTFPMMIGLSVLAEPGILVVYGDKWREAISIVQLLCFAGMAQSVYNTAAWIFLARGRTDILFRLGIYAAVIRIAGVFIGVRWGIIGVAWAYLLGGFLIWYPTWAAAGRLIGLRFRELMKNIAAPFYCAATMGVLIWVSDNWILGERTMEVRLAAQVIAGILIFGFLIKQFRLEAYYEVRDVILEMGGRRSRIIRWLVGG